MRYISHRGGITYIYILCEKSQRDYYIAPEGHRYGQTNILINLLLGSHKIKAISWQPACCTATADVIASSMPQPCGSSRF